MGPIIFEERNAMEIAAVKRSRLTAASFSTMLSSQVAQAGAPDDFLHLTRHVCEVGVAVRPRCVTAPIPAKHQAIDADLLHSVDLGHEFGIERPRHCR